MKYKIFTVTALTGGALAEQQEQICTGILV